MSSTARSEPAPRAGEQEVDEVIEARWETGTEVHISALRALGKIVQEISRDRHLQPRNAFDGRILKGRYLDIFS